MRWVGGISLHFVPLLRLLEKKIATLRRTPRTFAKAKRIRGFEPQSQQEKRRANARHFSWLGRRVQIRTPHL